MGHAGNHFRHIAGWLAAERKRPYHCVSRDGTHTCSYFHLLPDFGTGWPLSACFICDGSIGKLHFGNGDHSFHCLALENGGSPLCSYSICPILVFLLL